MTVRITLEYANAFPREGMVVWLKKSLQAVNNEALSQRCMFSAWGYVLPSFDALRVQRIRTC